VLSVNDTAGKRLVETVFAIQKVDPELYNFEFRMRRDASPNLSLRSVRDQAAIYIRQLSSWHVPCRCSQPEEAGSRAASKIPEDNDPVEDARSGSRGQGWSADAYARRFTLVAIAAGACDQLPQAPGPFPLLAGGQPLMHTRQLKGIAEKVIQLSRS
jgi:hypothetical protein